jgi:Type IV secretory pathway, VirB10 components
MPDAQVVQDIPPPPPPAKEEAPAATPSPPPAKKETIAVKTEPKAAPPAKPKKPEWGFLATGTQRQQPEAPPAEKPVKGAHLIDPAVWAVPQNVNRTLYRTQVLPCELLQKIDSDAPGQIQLGLTVPVFGFYGQGDELFPKGSKVVAMPVGKPDYGAKTIEVKLEQVHTPAGIVVEIPGDLGNEDGSSQLSGKVNSHWGATIGAAAINALINLGGGYLTGTPGRGQYYQDPAQKAMQEAAQSAQQDARTVVTRELKRGPTITRDPNRAGERFCTIQMLKNIQFSSHPLVVK